MHSLGDIDEVSFTNLKNSIKSEVKASEIRENHVKFVFMDASDRFWAVIVTQVEQS